MRGIVSRSTSLVSTGRAERPHGRPAKSVLLAACIGFLAPTTAYAIDFVDIAVEAFAVGGAAVGAPVSEDEKAVVKALTGCLIEGRPVLACGKITVISQLPQESRAVVECIAFGGNVAECGRDEVIRRLPPGAQAMASCMARAADLATCSDAALGTAESAALDTLKKLNATDEAKAFAPGTTGVQNIVNVVMGIREEDWGKVVSNGGKGVAKYTMKSVISTLFPVIGGAVSPAIDTVVDNRFDLAQDLYDATKNSDFAAIVRIGTEAYFTFQYEALCSLVDPPAVKEVICGSLGKVIGTIGRAAEVIARPFSAIIGETLEAFGSLANDIGKVFTGKDDNCGTPEDFYAAHFRTCYHRSTYLQSFGNAQPISSALYDGCRRNFIRCERSSQVSRICDPMRRMFESDTHNLAEALNVSAEKFVRARLSRLGTCRQPSGAQFEELVAACRRNAEASFPLPGKAMEWVTDAASTRCERNASDPPSFSDVSMHRTACEAAVGNVSLELRQICIRSVTVQIELFPGIVKDWQITSPALNYKPRNDFRLGENVALSPFQLYAGENWQHAFPFAGSGPNNPGRVALNIDPFPPGGGSIAPAGCFGNMIELDGECRCPPGLTWMEGEGGRCVDPASKGIVVVRSPRSCPPDRPVGSYPNCCPPGAILGEGKCYCSPPARWGNGVCEGGPAVLDVSGGTNGAYPGGYKPGCGGDRPIGTFPNCCPVGTSYRDGACRCSRKHPSAACRAIAGVPSRGESSGLRRGAKSGPVPPIVMRDPAPLGPTKWWRIPSGPRRQGGVGTAAVKPRDPIKPPPFLLDNGKAGGSLAKPPAKITRRPGAKAPKGSTPPLKFTKPSPSNSVTLKPSNKPFTIKPAPKRPSNDPNIFYGGCSTAACAAAGRRSKLN